MEEINETFFDVKIPEVTYSATFNPITGEVLAVGPTAAFPGQNNIIDLDKETAEMIIEGEINIINCAVDIRNMTFELLEKRTVSKIDDVLHKIIEKKWSKIDNPDIFITFNKKNKTFTVELTEEFHGTKKLPKKYQPIHKRKIIWDGDTVLNFYITDYNDPHILHSQFQILLKDLIDNKVVINDLSVPQKFTLYTRRVLKNYTIEIK